MRRQLPTPIIVSYHDTYHTYSKHHTHTHSSHAIPHTTPTSHIHAQTHTHFCAHAHMHAQLTHVILILGRMRQGDY